MKTLMKTAILMALTALPVLAQVTKEDIKKLAAAKVSDDVIVAFIRANGPAAKLSADDLIELQNAGVSEAVMKVMVGASAPAAAAPSLTPSQSDAEALRILNSYTPPKTNVQTVSYSADQGYYYNPPTYYAPATTRVYYSTPSYYYPTYTAPAYYYAGYTLGHSYGHKHHNHHNSWSSGHHHHKHSKGHWGFKWCW